ncbi:MAG: hypothetical protein J5958_03655 [Clostridia bacterium]|nr:hypothetical protein [Clostridia bacterium]
MKRILLCLLATATLLALVSCGAKKGKKITMYGDGVIPAIVVSDATPDSVVDQIGSVRETVAEYVGETPATLTAGEEKTGVEFVFGETDRAITERAKAILPALDGDNAAYAIYFDEDGVALVWNHDVAAMCAVKYFAEHYLGKSTLIVRSGTKYVGKISVSAYEEEFQMAEDAKFESVWASRFDVIENPSVRAAVKDFYEDFYEPEKLIRWWAGLYDPELGAFYYSNSARDYVGFLPDIESTMQIVNRLRQFDPDEDLANYLGPDITAKMISFLQSKQSKDDGYFYHPQWAQPYTELNTMRYTRDQDWTIAMLNWLHSAPLYPTAIDRAMASAANENQSEQSAPTAEGWTPNEASVKKYVNDLLDNTSCEHWSNKLDTQLETFAATGMLDAVLDVLDERVNPDYGLWVTGYDAATDKYSNMAGGTEVPYGIFTNTYKVMKCYNRGERLFKHSTKMVENVIKAILSEDPGVRSTYLFNPWATLGNVRSNLKDFGTPALLAQYDALISKNILGMLTAVKHTLGYYGWEDGSYSFLLSGSSPTIYSTLASLGAREGDVNANNLIVSFAGHICTAIGLSDPIPIFNQKHGKLMKQLLDNAPQIIKRNIVTSACDFSRDKVGAFPVWAKETSRQNGTTFKVVADPKNASNKVLEIKKDTEDRVNGGQITLPTLTVPEMTDRTVLEVSMRINVSENTRFGNNCDQNNPNIMQIKFVTADSPFWMPTLRFNSDETGYVLVVGKNTSTGTIESPDDQKTVFNFGEWYTFTFRISIKNYGKTGAEFKVEISVDGKPFGTSYCFYADGESSVTGGSIQFRTEATVGVRFAPQARIHAEIYVDDYSATLSHR